MAYREDIAGKQQTTPLRGRAAPIEASCVPSMRSRTVSSAFARVRAEHGWHDPRRSRDKVLEVNDAFLPDGRTQQDEIVAKLFGTVSPIPRTAASTEKATPA